MSSKRRSSRLSTHKERANWFQERATYPYRDVSPTELLSCRDHKQQHRWAYENPGHWPWQEVGPFNIGGRLTSLAFRASEPETVWVGSAAGGVWKTTDLGEHWAPCWQGPLTLNIGALACGPAHRLYVATGEANLSSDNYPGNGVYRSDDGGDTWTHHAAAHDQHLPLRLGAIAVNPANPDHLLLGGVTHLATEPAGLYCSWDAGVTWQRQTDGFSYPFVSSRNFFCHCLGFDQTGQTVFAGVEARGPLNGLWRSQDGGHNWSHLQLGLPAPERIGRTAIAVSPNSPTVYLLAENGRDGLQGIYRSDDLGDSWRPVLRRHANERQLAYNLCLAVHPQDPDFVVWGGVNIHRSFDGGKHWEQVTSWQARESSTRNVHSDHHALAITPRGHILSANDGGFDISRDRGGRWRNRSAGLRCTMFYDLDVAPTDARWIGGGAQDNGTLVCSPTTLRTGRFSREAGGDGGWMLFHPQDPRRIVGSAQRMTLHRRDSSGNWQDITPKRVPRAERHGVWMSFLAMDRTASGLRSLRLFAGTNRVWISRNQGDSWTPCSPNFDNSPITAIEICEAQPSVVLVGTTRGRIYRSVDGGVTWSGNVCGPELPATVVTRFAGHPIQPELVFCSVGGSPLITGVSTGYEVAERQRGQYGPAAGPAGFARVYVSRDSGLTWNPAYGDRGLPDVPHHCLVFETLPPFRLFVGADSGVFVSSDEGQNWTGVSGNLPPVMVTDLVYRDRHLYAATYGRGVWRVPVRKAR